ncbi:MAG: zinc-dependent metalloprotease [Silvanigrellales bacterium]|nr:zinc-dependent metalloprotease [Silvanigrellales bacterium]
MSLFPRERSRVAAFVPAVVTVSSLALGAVAGCGVASRKSSEFPVPQKRPEGVRATPPKPTARHLVEASSSFVQKELGDSGAMALGRAAFQERKGKGDVVALAPSDLAQFPASVRYARPRGEGLLAGMPTDVASSQGVVVGLPLRALGLSHVFGGVITTVSDGKSEALGSLKMSGLPSVVVRPLLSEFEGKVYLSLVGCLEACTEGSERRPVVDVPVLGKSLAGDTLFVDLAPLATNLKIQNLSSGLFDDAKPAEVTTKSTSTSLVDFGLDTLVFDITSKMELQEKDTSGAPGEVRPFDLVTRYFMRMESTLDSSFEPRPNVPGVGYFTTARAKHEKISRFGLTDHGNGAPIHYYVKNVPAEWKSAFDASFAAWQATFESLTGRNVLTWEHVDPASELQALIVAGDARYNVLEWDVVNAASYGGLGPSISNETSGQLLSAQTLIQGPAILELYSGWYDTWKKVRELEKEGRGLEAERIVRDYDALMASKARPNATRQAPRLSLNNRLAFRIPSADETLRDPIVKGEFFNFPETETFESYMNGYFEDMVAHELGHNLGLRHNFRGSLGRAGELPEGRVSVSVMEYLDRNFRNRSRVGEYDTMAIAYGYTGLKPARTDLFCTDNEVASLVPDSSTLRFPSPECSSSDGGVDGYGYHKASLVKGVNLLLAPELSEASPWEPSDLYGRFSIYGEGLLAYAKAAPDTFSTWTNWTGKPGFPVRPVGAKRVRAFVVADFQQAVCSLSRIESALAAKASAEAKEATRKKARAQMEFVVDFAKKEAGLTDAELSGCKASLDALSEETSNILSSGLR